MHNLKIRKVAPFCGLSGLGLELGPSLDIERRKRTWGVLGGICRISHFVGAGSAERATPLRHSWSTLLFIASGSENSQNNFQKK